MFIFIRPEDQLWYLVNVEQKKACWSKLTEYSSQVSSGHRQPVFGVTVHIIKGIGTFNKQRLAELPVDVILSVPIRIGKRHLCAARVAFLAVRGSITGVTVRGDPTAGHRIVML